MAPEPGRAHGGQFEGARANSGLKGTAANLSLFIFLLSTSKSVPFQPNSYNYSRRFFCPVSAHSSLLGWADSPRTISFFILLLPPFSANRKVLQFSPLALFPSLFWHNFNNTLSPEEISSTLFPGWKIVIFLRRQDGGWWPRLFRRSRGAPHGIDEAHYCWLNYLLLDDFGLGLFCANLIAPFVGDDFTIFASFAQVLIKQWHQNRQFEQDWNLFLNNFSEKFVGFFSFRKFFLFLNHESPWQNFFQAVGTNPVPPTPSGRFPEPLFACDLQLCTQQPD